MDILVIGNGFDLAHKLPTTYADFLRFTRLIQDILKVEFSEVNWDGVNEKLKEVITDNLSSNTNHIYPRALEWQDLIEGNFWIEHFNRCRNYKDKNWIDFESEISSVVQAIDIGIHTDDKQGITTEYNMDYECVEVKYKEHTIFTLEEKEYYLDDVIATAHEKLYIDLKKLTRALELYLVLYVNNIVIDIKSPDIEALNPDKVLSFNYTDTYDKLYAPTTGVEYDFIHGKAEYLRDLETNNMVLGIDEYLPNDRKDKEVQFIAYKKYYQRIFKGTGCLYKDWVELMQSQTYKHTSGNMPVAAGAHQLYVFGHSLDITDKDVLKVLIVNDWVETTIFYYNRIDLGQKIANLVKVIGQDELIKRTGGPTKTITFKQQADMVSAVRK